jgi:hypothetical protein
MSSNTSGTPRPKREREESQSKRERERGCTVVGVGHEGVAECLEGRKSLWRTTEKLRDLLKEGTLMRDGHAVTEREGRKEMLRRVVTACRRIHPQVKERERDGEQRENRTKGNFCDDSEWTAISGPILLPVAPTHLFVTTTNWVRSLSSRIERREKIILIFEYITKSNTHHPSSLTHKLIRLTEIDRLNMECGRHVTEQDKASCRHLLKVQGATWRRGREGRGEEGDVERESVVLYHQPIATIADSMIGDSEGVRGELRTEGEGVSERIQAEPSVSVEYTLKESTCPCDDCSNSEHRGWRESIRKERERGRKGGGGCLLTYETFIKFWNLRIFQNTLRMRKEIVKKYLDGC